MMEQTPILEYGVMELIFIQLVLERVYELTHLMELLSYMEFSHLKHPLINQVLSVAEGMALKERDPTLETPAMHASLPIAIGAK